MAMLRFIFLIIVLIGVSLAPSAYPNDESSTLNSLNPLTESSLESLTGAATRFEAHVIENGVHFIDSERGVLLGVKTATGWHYQRLGSLVNPYYDDLSVSQSIELNRVERTGELTQAVLRIRANAEAKGHAGEYFSALFVESKTLDICLILQDAAIVISCVCRLEGKDRHF